MRFKNLLVISLLLLIGSCAVTKEPLKLKPSDFKNAPVSQLSKIDKAYLKPLAGAEKKVVKLSTDILFNNRVNCIFLRLKDALPKTIEASKLEVIVIEDPAANAFFSNASSTLTVTSGLSKLTDTNDELAVVIATVISPVSREQNIKRLQKASVINNFLFKNKVSPEAKTLTMMSMNIPTTKERIQTDESGRKLMTTAGFNPVASLTLLEKLKSQLRPMSEDDSEMFRVNYEKQTLEFEQRINAANQDIAKLESKYKEALTNNQSCI